MPRHYIVVLAMACAGLASGCAAPRDGHFRHPGNIKSQRLRAVIHDPYPDPDQGPPVMGGRPRDFSDPLPEAVRNRIFVDSYWGR